MYDKELLHEKLRQVSAALDRVARRFAGIVLPMILLKVNRAWIYWTVSA